VGYGLERNLGPISEKGWGFVFAEKFKNFA
jgi:hypothetical protein